MGFNNFRAGNPAFAGSSPVIAPASFGELLVVTPFPTAQGDFVHEISSRIFATSSIGSAAVSYAGNIMTASSGITSGEYSMCTLAKSLKYRPGQLSQARITALFDQPISGTNQLVGVFNPENGYFIGYKNEDFGVVHRSNGKQHIQMFTITTAAAGLETITLTLDGKASTFSMNPGGDITKAAFLIANNIYTTANGWLAEQGTSAVTFISKRAQACTGTFSLASSLGGSGTTATTTNVRSGSAQIENFIPQGLFNFDTLDGKGPSRLVLDKTKGNVYQIDYQYLGFGNALFNVENPDTGNLMPFHMLKNANTRVTTVLSDPSTRAGWLAENIGSIAQVNIKGASAATFVDGFVREEIGPKFGYLTTKSHAGNSGEVLAIAFRRNKNFNGKACHGEIDFLRIDAGEEHTGPVIVRLKKNPTFTTAVATSWTNVDSLNSIMSYTTVGTITGGYDIAAFIVPPQSSNSISLKDLAVYIGEEHVIAITVQELKSNASTANSHIHITWVENQ